MNRFKSLTLVNALALIAVMVVNSLSVSLPINGYSTVELSDSYPNLFVPAGQTFSIWGIIYLSLIIFLLLEIYHAFIRKEASGPTTKIASLFLLSCFANASWIFAWHYLQVGLSLLCMLVLFISLIAIYETLKNDNVWSKSAWARIPFSLYQGWISIALIANVTALLVHHGWGGGFGIDPALWVVILIGVGMILGLVYLVRNNDIFFPLVIAWAFYGIYLKRSSPNLEAEGLIIMASIGACSVILLAVFAQLLRKRSIY